MIGGGRAQDHKVGAGRHAGGNIGEDMPGRYPEGCDGALHPGRIKVTDARDFCIGVFVDLPQQIAHHMVKVDADDAEFWGHEARLLQRRNENGGGAVRGQFMPWPGPMGHPARPPQTARLLGRHRPAHYARSAER